MDLAISRRAFVAASSAALAATLVRPKDAQADSHSNPTGPVYARSGPGGIVPGTARSPSRGEAILLDGSVVAVSPCASMAIPPGRSLYLIPNGKGVWSILYAEC